MLASSWSSPPPDRPRAVMVMVMAGPPVDAVIDELVPRLAAGDTIVDEATRSSATPSGESASSPIAASASWASASPEARTAHGPSIIPGSDRQAYADVEHVSRR
jgi:6-phosphogluconate dehydrogenase